MAFITFTSVYLSIWLLRVGVLLSVDSFSAWSLATQSVAHEPAALASAGSLLEKRTRPPWPPEWESAFHQDPHVLCYTLQFKKHSIPTVCTEGHHYLQQRERLIWWLLLCDAFYQGHSRLPPLDCLPFYMECLPAQWTWVLVCSGSTQPGRRAPRGNKSPSLGHSSEKFCASGSLEL